MIVGRGFPYLFTQDITTTTPTSSLCDTVNTRDPSKTRDYQQITGIPSMRFMTTHTGDLLLRIRGIGATYGVPIHRMSLAVCQLQMLSIRNVIVWQQHRATENADLITVRTIRPFALAA